MNRTLFRHKYARRGTAVVEAAVMAPLVVTAMLGMIEVGYSFMIRQTVTLASREGARAAALPGGTLADVNAAVDGAMEGPGLTGYTVTSNVATLAPTDATIQDWLRRAKRGEGLGQPTGNVDAAVAPSADRKE